MDNCGRLVLEAARHRPGLPTTPIVGQRKPLRHMTFRLASCAMARCRQWTLVDRDEHVIYSTLL